MIDGPMWSRRPLIATFLSALVGSRAQSLPIATPAAREPSQTPDPFAFTQGCSAAVIRDFRAKMREQTSVRDFRGSDSEAWNAAVASGAKDILIPRGDYGIDASVVISGQGIGFRGETDHGVNLRVIGANELFVIGRADDVVEHVTLRGFTFGSDASFSGKALIRIKRGFQIYLERLRYKDSFKSPTEAIYVFDNNAGQEQPVRTTVRDCYIDGADYNPKNTGKPAPIGFWNTGGIQTLFENTHIQDCQIGWKLGLDSAIDKKYHSERDHDGNDFYDMYISNNCRFQVGDRGGTTSSARALDIWQGSGVHISQSQFYLNNNAPDPAMAGQRIAVFNHPNFGAFSMEQCTINGNARTDHFFETAQGAGVRRLAIGTGNDWGGLVAGKGLVKKGAGSTIRTIVDPSNLFDNPNNFGPVDQLSNADISQYDLGSGATHYIQINDGERRSLLNFKNGVIGQLYIVQFEITGGSLVFLAASTPCTTQVREGIVVDGFPGADVPIVNGDTLIVTRVPLAAVESYRAKLIRGGNLVATVLQLQPSALPSVPAFKGQIVLDAADGKYKASVNGTWRNIAFEA